MKILVFCPYYPPHTGGLETHADEFNEYLSRKGIDIIVFTPRLPQNAPEKEIKYRDVHPHTNFNNTSRTEKQNSVEIGVGVKIIRFPAFEIISNYPLPKFWKPKFWQLFFSLFGEKFDIAISRTRFFNTSLLALIYSKITRTKWIHIEHGSAFVELSSQFKTFVAKAYDHTFGFLIFKFSDLNISISKTVQKFVYKFDQRNSPVIYRGLDVETIDKIQPDTKMKKHYANKIIISFVGRLYKWKGVENSIKAIKSLPPEIKERIIFLIIGDGEDFLRLKKTSSEEKAIKMLGNIPREKAIALLKIIDIYIHSSYPGGGLSTSLLEAMYCECAIIATPNEGANEVIENNKNGFLIEKSDQKLISEKIKEVLNKNTDEQKEAAKDSIEASFIWEKSIDRYKAYL